MNHVATPLPSGARWWRKSARINSWSPGFLAASTSIPAPRRSIASSSVSRRALSKTVSSKWSASGMATKPIGTSISGRSRWCCACRWRVSSGATIGWQAKAPAPLCRHGKRSLMKSYFALIVMLAAPALCAAAEAVAATPPMGWNSWDCYGTTVTEAEVKANADYMAQHLKQHGWQYVVVDIQWSEPHAQAHGYRPGAQLSVDQYGRLIPAVNRFPSSADGHGFRPLADYIHGLGLRFGIHIMRGIPRQAVKANLPVFAGVPQMARAADIADTASVCPWNSDMYGVDLSRPGGQDYYDSILKLYADWGVDYIKADDIARPAHREEIAALHRAIVKTGRPIVLSLSPGPAMIK